MQYLSYSIHISNYKFAVNNLVEALLALCLAMLFLVFIGKISLSLSTKRFAETVESASDIYGGEHTLKKIKKTL